jgi:O-antigen/teichoic acid export membrane protein
MTLTTVSAHLNQMTDYIVIGWVLSPTHVTKFLLTQRFVDTLGGYATHNVSISSWPILSEVLKSEGRVEFQRRLLELIRVLLGFGTIIVGTLAAYNAHFVTQWVGFEYYGGDLLSILTAAQMVIFGWVVLFNLVVDGLGDVRDRAGVSLSAAVANVGLSFLLAWWLGLYGVTVASIVTYLAGDAWMSPYALCRRYGVMPRVVVSTALRALCLAALWVTALWYVAHRGVAIGSWLFFGSELALATTAGVLYFVVVILTPEDRRTWLNRIRGAATRRIPDE